MHVGLVLGMTVALAVAIGTALRVGVDHGARDAGAIAGRRESMPTLWRHAGVWRLPDLPAEPIDVAWLRVPGRAPQVVVADGRNRVVLLVDATSGAVRATWTPPSGIAELSPLAGRPTVVFPLAVAADGARERLYILWAEIGWDDPRFRGFSPLYIETRAPDGRSIGLARRQPGHILDGRLGAIVDLAVGPADGRLLASVGGYVDLLDPATGATSSVGRLGREDELARIAAQPDGSIALASPDAGLVVVFDASGEILGRIDLAAERLAPVAVAADAAGRLALFVRPQDAVAPGDDPPTPDPHAPLVLLYDRELRREATRSAAELGVAAPRGFWPWSIDVDPLGAGSGMVFVTTGERVVVHARTALDTPSGAFEGAEASDAPAWLPRLDIGGAAFGPGIALSAEGIAGLHLAAVDNRGEVLAGFDASGAPRDGVPLPPSVVDVAGGASGALFASTGDGAVYRFDGPPFRRDAPTWAWAWGSAPGAPLGGRLAVAGGRLWISRPKARSLTSLDLGVGVPLGAPEVGRPDAIGLWPSDVARAVDPGGELLAADLIAGEVGRWDPVSGRELGRLPVGLGAGATRIAAARLDSGDALLVALTADGAVEAHGVLSDGANLIARWRPAGPEGGPIEGDDIAVDGAGRIFVSDRGAAGIHVFEPVAEPEPGTPAATATPSASPTPSDRACAVSGDKVAGPATVVLGRTATVTLTLAADCPGRLVHSGADIVLAIDRSASMAGDKLDAARSAAATLVALLDVRFHRVGLVSFADDAALEAELSHDVVPALDALERVVAEGGTDLAAPVAEAARHLDESGRPDALPVIILLTDGRHTDGTGDPAAEAARARASGIRIHTIGLGFDVDADLLRAVAGSDARFHAAPRPSDLFPIYADILREVVASLAGRLEIADELGSDVSLVAGSDSPPALTSPGQLRWGRSILPADGITLTYAVRPERLGRVPINRRAFAEFDDGDGVRRRFDFPVPEVLVIAPSPTATGTATPTPRPTTTPAPAHLPLVSRGACLPGLRRADIVIVIDTSSSMAGAKLDQAKAAAVAFVERLDLPRDQAALVGFDEHAQTRSGLTGSAAALVSAIGALETGSGTRIDRALRAAAAILAGDPAREARNRPVVILLTDGAHGGARDPVVALAAAIKASGVWVHAIGLGTDADMALLTAVASPDGVHFAPGPEDLAAIYARLAGVIPCR